MVFTVMLGWLPTSDILGVHMQAEQSMVGKVLSNLGILPPMVGSRSTRVTAYPASAMSRAACMPAMPPPTTSAFFVTGICSVNSGVLRATFATAIFTRSLAFSVASALSVWTQLHCSRRLATSSI